MTNPSPYEMGYTEDTEDEPAEQPAKYWYCSDPDCDGHLTWEGLMAEHE